MIIRYFLFWLPMIVIAFANATLRELVFISRYDASEAHQLSTLTLIILCALYVWFMFPLFHIHNTKQALSAGGIWVILTVMFEFTLGRFTQRSWEYLLQDYNLLNGRIWSIFLLCLLLMPYTVYRFRKRE